jgi:hypothetical protein
MIVLALALVAALLAVISLVQSRGTALLGWAVLALAAIHLIPLLT